MNTYDQIIFDELVQHRPVQLNEVGCLQVATRSARMDKGNSLSAPRNIVIFTPTAPDNARNIVDILAEKGTDNQNAWDQYNEWLAGSRKDGKLVIDGVGTLENDIFTPTAEFDKALNPNSPGAVAVKPRSKAWVWVLVVIALLALFVALGLKYCDDPGKDKSAAPKTTVTTNPTEPAAPVATQPGAAASASSQRSGLGFPVEGRHYVVAGVFDIPANADRQIEYLKRNFPDLTPEKFSYPGVRPGRTMVTAYSSTNRSEALKVRRQLAWDYDLYEYWLFPEEK